VSRQVSVLVGKDGTVHLCDGMHLEDGTSFAWSLCQRATNSQTLSSDQHYVTCRECRAVRSAERILTGRRLAWGPPDLISSSWPRSMQ